MFIWSFVQSVAMTTIFQMPLRVILVLLYAPSMVHRQRRFRGSFVPILPTIGGNSYFFRVSKVYTMGPHTVLFSGVGTLFIRTMQISSFGRVLRGLYGANAFLVGSRFGTLYMSVVQTIRHIYYSINSPNFNHPCAKRHIGGVLSTPGTPTYGMCHFRALSFPFFANAIYVRTLCSLQFPY